MDAVVVTRSKSLALVHKTKDFGVELLRITHSHGATHIRISGWAVALFVALVIAAF
jgi:hypothetical protein